ncbi:MAG: hypothetical protein KGI49_00655 [Patescibacteria group bacterium]|nr:hypothetical protein [Patescibacteria group bacterium]
MGDYTKIILLIIVAFIGAGAIAYFYMSADIFADVLKRPLRIVSMGMLSIDIGVLAVALVTYQSITGGSLAVYGVPLSWSFYIFYGLGSALIIAGSSKFARKPKQ